MKLYPISHANKFKELIQQKCPNNSMLVIDKMEFLPKLVSFQKYKESNFKFFIQRLGQ